MDSTVTAMELSNICNELIVNDDASDNYPDDEDEGRIYSLFLNASTISIQRLGGSSAPQNIFTHFYLN